MKTIHTLLIFLTIILSFTISVSAAKSPANEGIEKAVSFYIQCIDTRDVNSLEKILTSDAQVITVNKIINKTSAQNGGEFLEQIKHGSAGGWKRNLEIVAIDGDDKVATAKVVITDKKVKQLGFISLVNDSGEWQIISCVSTIELNK